ncbi:hypothetical protein [Nonomuraea basaltis]|uniref:hypothetical protein n=1 Tax=Nonomuraea basaltis TaxID=2495887 RepID=UPI00110C662D|nr:hypothetical protein [Nonomuraea basaltis]TMS00559.1 hypothetical protein EJK15_01005 [Nonomuraea basaltis]
MTHTSPGYPARDRDGHPHSTVRRIASAVAGRWPTYLGIALAAATLFDGDGGPNGALIVTVAALSYLTVAVLDRPGAVWLVIVVLFGIGTAADTVGIGYWLAFGPIALIVTVIGLVRGQLRRPGLYVLQAPQMLVVGVVVLLAEYGGLEFAGYLVAAALIGHAVWDVAHWRANKVVTRSLAEFCFVIDSLLGLGIIILLVLA